MRIELKLNPTEEFAKLIIDKQIKFFEYDSKDIYDLSERYYSNPEAYVLAYEGDEIIGCVNLLRRSITFDSKNILLGGFGGVCVSPEFRHRGIAKEMLIVGMEHLRKWGCDIAYLCTETETTGKLYELIGFIALKQKRRSVGTSGKEYIHSGGMIAPVISKEKFNLVLNSNNILDLQGGDW